MERHENEIRRQLRAGTRWLPAEDERDADLVVEHPPYRRFRNPIDLAKLAIGRVRFAGIGSLRG